MKVVTLKNTIKGKGYTVKIHFCPVKRISFFEQDGKKTQMANTQKGWEIVNSLQSFGFSRVDTWED